MTSYEFDLKDICSRCNNRIKCTHQITDITDIVDNVLKVQDGSSFKNGVFKLKGTIIFQLESEGKWKEVLICSNCQSATTPKYTNS